MRIIAKENQTSLPTVSSRYRHINTLDVHEVLKDNGFIEKGYREANVRLPERQGFQRHMSIFYRPEMQDGAHGDFNVMLFNGHDGTTAIRLELGYFRVVCENQLINSELGCKVTHTGNALERLNSRIPILLKGYEDFRALKERMVSKEFSPEATRELIMEAVRIRELDGMHLENESIKGQVIEYNLKAMDYTRRTDDRGSNAWSTLNRIQENMIRGTTWEIATTTKAGAINYRKLRAVTNLDRVINYNKQLTGKAIELMGVA